MRGTTCIAGMAHHLPVVNVMAVALDIMPLPLPSIAGEVIGRSTMQSAADHATPTHSVARG